MKLTIMVALCLTLFAGCTNSTVQSVLKPITSAACGDETAAVNAIASSFASTFQCSSLSSIQASLTTALGNANICNYVSTAAPALKADAVKPQGVIGNLVCPVAISAAIGFATQAIPSSWGCTAQVEGAALQASLTSLCETAVPFVAKPAAK